MVLTFTLEILFVCFIFSVTVGDSSIILSLLETELHYAGLITPKCHKFDLVSREVLKNTVNFNQLWSNAFFLLTGRATFEFSIREKYILCLRSCTLHFSSQIDDTLTIITVNYSQLQSITVNYSSYSQGSLLQH